MCAWVSNRRASFATHRAILSPTTRMFVSVFNSNRTIYLDFNEFPDSLRVNASQNCRNFARLWLRADRIASTWAQSFRLHMFPALRLTTPGHHNWLTARSSLHRRASWYARFTYVIAPLRSTRSNMDAIIAGVMRKCNHFETMRIDISLVCVASIEQRAATHTYK